MPPPPARRVVIGGGRQPPHPPPAPVGHRAPPPVPAGSGIRMTPVVITDPPGAVVLALPMNDTEAIVLLLEMFPGSYLVDRNGRKL